MLRIEATSPHGNDRMWQGDFFGRLGIYSRTAEGPLFCGVPVASRNTNEHHDGIAVGRPLLLLFTTKLCI